MTPLWRQNRKTKILNSKPAIKRKVNGGGNFEKNHGKKTLLKCSASANETAVRTLQLIDIKT